MRLDDFEEAKHPRDKDGKFGSGGSPKEVKAKGMLAKAQAEHAANHAKLALGTPEEQVAAKIAHFKSGKKVAAAKHVLKKLTSAVIALEPETQPPDHPKLASAKDKHAVAVKEHEAAKAALSSVAKTGDAQLIQAAKAEHFKAGKKVAAAKYVVKKLSNPTTTTIVALAPPPPPPKPEPPKAPAPHLEHGATVKIEGGKSEHGGVLAGTVVGWSKEPGMTAVLQLGKTEAQWHENSKLSGHNVISAWAKQQETVGKEVAKDLGPGVSTTGKMSLEHEVKSAVAKIASAEKAKAEAAKQAASKEVEAAKNNPDLVHKDAHKWGIIHFKQWEASLTPQEHSAVKGYTNSEYSQINGYLRFGQNADKGTIAKVEAIQTALLKSPGLPHAMVLKRGMGGTFPIAPGDTYEDKGFMSTSVGGGHLQRQNILHITAQAGAKGAFMTMSTHTTETEFLLPHGSKMKVTKVEVKGSVRHIHGELLPHGHQDTIDGDEVPLELPDSGVDLSNSDKLNGEAEDIIIYRDGKIIHNGPEMRRRGGSGY